MLIVHFVIMVLNAVAAGMLQEGMLFYYNIAFAFLNGIMVIVEFRKKFTIEFKIKSK